MSDDRNQLIRELEKRIAYERLLTQISAMAVNPTDINAFQNDCLSLMGEATRVDRIYIFEYRYEKKVADNTFEWCTEGVDAQIESLQGLDIQELSWWTDALCLDKIIYYEDVDEIVDTPVRELLKRQGIVSILVVPMIVAGELYGFIGFDICRAGIKWSDADIELIKMASRIVCDAIVRFETQARLFESQQQLLSVFDSISDPVYVADTETYEILFVNKATRMTLKGKVIGEKCYRIFHDYDSPCPFCTNDIIKKSAPQPYRWEFFNPKVNRHYSICDRLIEWPDGRKVRLELATDVTEHKRAEAAFLQSEKRMSLVFNAIEDAYWDCHFPSGNVYFSPSFYTMLGYRPGEFEPGMNVWRDLMHSDDLARIVTVEDHINTSASDNYRAEFRLRTSSGKYKWIMARGKVVERGESGEAVRLVGSHTDISQRKAAEEDQKKLQEQLAQSQKIESIGRLAGGVAHDFNNMLGVIIGRSEMIMEEAGSETSFYEDAREIHLAASRSAELTRQLLAFARKQPIEPRILETNQTIERMLQMLRRLIGEDTVLQWKAGRDVWPVKIDPAQLDQIMTNLCVNARDAIAEHGKIFIETANAVFDEDYCSSRNGFIPGEFVEIAVGDNGRGMTPEILDKIFEPFFTTKKLGKGTGLGLAIIHGIITQNNGFINVSSESGHGSVFRLYLPRQEYPGTTDLKVTESLPQTQVSETILLVEDEPALLKLCKRYLERMGYLVYSTDSPEEAIGLASSTHIDLLLTDVVMPEMNGKVLSERILAVNPQICVLFMSGYTANIVLSHGIFDDKFGYIQKPFSYKDLSACLRVILNKKSNS